MLSDETITRQIRVSLFWAKTSVLYIISKLCVIIYLINSTKSWDSVAAKIYQTMEMRKH